MLDCSELTYQAMADIVRSIRIEVKKRNPIFVNAYIGAISVCIDALDEISSGEEENPTSEIWPDEVRA